MKALKIILTVLFTIIFIPVSVAISIYAVIKGGVLSIKKILHKKNT